MALTHVFSRLDFDARKADLSTLRGQVNTALNTLQAQIDDANVTNAEAVSYIKQQAQIKKAMIRALVRLAK
jgi:hypothetical protein